LLLGYQTDSRRFAMDYNNLMIDNTLTGGVAHSLDELSTLVQSSIQKINEQKLNGSNRT